FMESDAQGVFHAVADREAWLVLVELDPREGSGVIPSDWLARFGAGGKQGLAVVGRQIGAEGVWKPLLSAFPRDYSYDAFLLEFSRTFEGAPVLRPADAEAELLVRIHNKQGHVRWKIPPDVR
ncbi:MAG TPA: hypothetical protein VN673_14340, partial [Clostridia bacterium]|nr:hypothetical protein [Clostridia bacterium]